MGKHRLAALFDPESVVAYVPKDAAHPSAVQLLQALSEGEFAGSVHRRSTSGKALKDGNTSKPPERVDLALIAGGPEDAVEALQHAATLKARAAIVYDDEPFAGDEDAGVVAREAARLGIALLGPGCSGIQRPPRSFNACIAGPLQQAGNVGLISQSGSLTAAMLDWAASNAVKFSAVVATGRSQSLDLADVLDFMAQDSHTHSIVMYMEGIRSARRFMSALRTAARAKPVIVLKAGRRPAGQQAALTHSGMLVGGDDVFDAALRRAGAVRVESFVQLFSAAKCLAARYRPGGTRLGVVCNGGGPGVLAADYAHLRHVDIPTLSETLQANIRKALPDAVTANPVDLGENSQAAAFVTATELLAASNEVDGVLVVVTPKPGVDTQAITDAAIARLPKVSKPVFACWMGETRARATREQINAAGMPIFRLPEAAVDAFANIAAFYRNQQQLMQTPPPLSATVEADQPDTTAARALIERVLAEGRNTLTETESKALLAAFRIPVTPTVVAHDVEEAVRLATELGFPVAMKINSPDIAHKSDVGGVMLNLRSPQQVRAVFIDMIEEAARRAPGAKIDGVSLQRMVLKRHGRELFVGMTTDPLFGPVVTFGAGGTMIEVIDDRSVALPPLNPFLARQMIERARSSAVLRAWRGHPAVPMEAVEALLLRVSDMICELPELAELDINPIIVDEHGAAAVDARAVVRAARASRTPHAHLAILPYPDTLTRDATLKDGTTLRLRAIRPEDADALQAFVRELSDEARYFRFLSTMHELTPSMLARFTQIDYDREMAMLALQGEHIVGVARYMLNPDAETCEFGLVVADALQGRGVGTLLMNTLVSIARDRGLKEIIGIVAANNHGMLALMERLGFCEKVDAEDPDLKVVGLALN